MVAQKELTSVLDKKNCGGWGVPLKRILKINQVFRILCKFQW
jgi:hypothetical protein